MRVGKVRTSFILMHSLWVMIYYSCRVLFSSFRNKLTRDQINGYTCTWSQKLLDIVKVRVKMVAEHDITPIPGRRYIIMSNHASLYDIPIILCSFPKFSIRMIAKKELFKVPIWGKALEKAEFMSIDREDRHQAVKDLEIAKAKLADGISSWIAPEGTRTRTGKMGELKKGGIVLAIKTEAIIIPVGLRGTQNVLPVDTWKISLGEEVEVHVGEPIDAAEYTLKQRNDLLKRLDKTLHVLVGEEPSES